MDKDTKNKRKKELLETFNYRYSVKEFDSTKKIDNEDFEFILEAGRLSPSSIGSEPWQFVVLQNPDIRQQIADISFGAKGQLPTASHVVIILVRKDTWFDSKYIEYIAKEVRGFDDERYKKSIPMYESFQKDDMNIFDERTLLDWAIKQTYIALANMMTAAAYIGIDSCAIEGFNYDKARVILKNANILNDDYDISVICAFGYRSIDPKRPKTRRKLEDITTYIN
ncbi:MAG: NAD(P)H-dependent oxidoreductase [Defluviitaleaceae bacterium]|nr:NAD(P)H-dependent oxidoreductase [Defluviitaleaceae bacterium]